MRLLSEHRLWRVAFLDAQLGFLEGLLDTAQQAALRGLPSSILGQEVKGLWQLLSLHGRFQGPHDLRLKLSKAFSSPALLRRPADASEPTRRTSM